MREDVDTGLFIALLNPAIALALSAAFLMLWLHQRQRPYLAVLALGYSASATGFLLQYFVLPIGLPFSRLASNLAFILGAWCLSAAIISRYGRKIPHLAIGALSAGGLAGFCWFMFVEPDLTWRVYAINFAFGGVSLVVAAELNRVRRNGPIETILFVLALLSGLNFFVRTVIAMKLNGPLVSYEGFYQSLYWTTALLSHALLSLLIALSLFTAAALDVMKALKADSHTDALSKLLNRRGFEERVAALLARRNGNVSALLLADLDHFKSLNDKYGHAVGDLVIEAFAARLREEAGRDAVVGRVGGEEFAVMLPDADFVAARAFAERMRSSFQAVVVDGLPRTVKLSASFGIAAPSAGEALSDIMRRADDALYQAKRNGRDTVRLSYLRTDPDIKIAARLSGFNTAGVQLH